jgi:hypothetical protein
MSPPTRKQPTAARPRFWRVSIMGQRSEYLGIVEAPDRQAAEIIAVRQFKLTDEQRRRWSPSARTERHLLPDLSESVAELR